MMAAAASRRLRTFLISFALFIHLNGLQIRDNCLDLGRLKKILKGRHAWRPIKDVLSPDRFVCAAGAFIQRRTVRSGIARGGQMADATSLSQDLTPRALVRVEAIARLLGAGVLGGSAQQQQRHRESTLYRSRSKR